MTGREMTKDGIGDDKEEGSRGTEKTRHSHESENLI